MPDVLFGRAAVPMFEAALRDLGSMAEIDAPGFRAQLSGPRPVVALLIEGEGEDFYNLDRTMRSYVDAARDVLTLVYGGTTRMLADVLEREIEGQWKTVAMAAGGPGWQHSEFQALAPDGYKPPIASAEEMLIAIAASRLTAFWIRLYTAALTESAWDVRIFRLWSVVETIAKSVVPGGLEVSRTDGATIMNGKTNATTAEPLPRVYELLRRTHVALGVPASVAVCHPDHELWDEVRAWYSIRNAVAHDGSWGATAQGGVIVEERIVRAARPGGTFEEGCDRYRRHLEANVEAVIHAAIAGVFDDPE